jgi:hypothetical protein
MADRNIPPIVEVSEDLLATAWAHLPSIAKLGKKAMSSFWPDPNIVGETKLTVAYVPLSGIQIDARKTLMETDDEDEGHREAVRYREVDLDEETGIITAYHEALRVMDDNGNIIISDEQTKGEEKPRRLSYREYERYLRQSENPEIEAIEDALLHTFTEEKLAYFMRLFKHI